MDIHRRLRDNIELLGERRGFFKENPRELNVAKLARAAKASPNTVHSAIKGRYSTSLGSLVKIARALGVDVARLLAPSAMIDEDMAGEVGPLMDDYWRATPKGRETIREVAAAQAFAEARRLTRPADPSTDSTD